jgi:Transposase DDE domain
VLILTPGNTADCVMAQECVSLIPGIKELLADKGYDTDAFRAFLRRRESSRSSRANPIARSASGMTKRHIKTQRHRALLRKAQGLPPHRHAL